MYLKPIKHYAFMRLTPQAKKDLQLLASVQPEKLDDIISAFADALRMNKYPEILKITGETFADKQLDVNTANDIIGILHLLSRFTENEKEKEEFLRGVELLGFNSTELEKIKQIINKLEETGFTSFAVDLHKRTELENDGPRKLIRFNIITDYRSFTRSNGTKELIPVFICDIDTAYKTNGTNQEMERLTFQLSPEQLNTVIDRLQEFRKGSMEEMEEIRKMKSAIGVSNV